jgi:hypothetical protein
VACVNTCFCCIERKGILWAPHQSDAKLGTKSSWFSREVCIAFRNVVEGVFYCSDDLADIVKRQTRSQEVECV